MRTFVPVIVAVFLAVDAPAQSNLTTETLRPRVLDAVKIGAGNPDRVIDALDKAVKAEWGDIEKNSIRLASYTTSFLAIATPPYAAYRLALKERIRKLEPVEDLNYDGAVVKIALAPAKMDAPDIVKIVIKRDEIIIEPIASDLSVDEFKNGFGQAVRLHSGTVTFPVGAFAPGAKVSVVMIPSVGDNIVDKLDPKQLAKFR
jgi:hypothetical protein